MFRRQQFDRVNPRNVVPSRHTLFIRGLPGTTDVTKVKDFFSGETNSKCSVDFFSTSDDKKRLSVAIRFKSHDVAKEILAKYNNKHLMGFPVELSWFKDLKKARAKMFEEQRQSGGRSFQRQGFRGNFRGNDRRGIATSPGGYFDGDRRMRAGSSSSGGAGGGNVGRPRYSNSRSRSFTGSSSRTGSASGRSISGSPQTRRSYQQNVGRGFSDGQTGQLGDRHPPHNQSYRSMSRTSSSSRSPQRMDTRNSSAAAAVPMQKSQTNRFQHGRGTASPLNMSHSSRRGQRMSASLEENAHEYSFSNAPAPEADGSSLVSGLIQLKRRQQPEISDPRSSGRKRRSSIASSSSGLSPPPLNSTAGAGRNRLTSVSPPFTNSSSFMKDTLSQDQMKDADQSDFPKRKRQRRITKSPDSLSPPLIRGSYMDSAKHPSSSEQQVARRTRQTTDTVAREDELDRQFQSSVDPRLQGSGDEQYNQDGSWHRSSRKAQDKFRKLSKPSNAGDSSFSDVDEFPPKRRGEVKNVVSDEALENGPSKTETLSDDPIELIRQKKEALSQDYKRDCEAFTTVVRMLISKDTELESRLMPMLKEILHERGQRCIEELRTFIADHQSELDRTEGTELPTS